MLSKLATSTWVTHLWEFSHLHRLEICLPKLDLPSSSCGNDAALVDLLLNSGWKDEKLRLANQNSGFLQVYFISDLLILGSNKIKRCFLQVKKDESTFSTHDWPAVRTSKDSIFAWKNEMLDISNIDGTLRQSIRWYSEMSSHRKINAKVNADNTFIFVKVSETEIIYYDADKSRSSHRYKRCPIAHNFIPSDKIHVDASLSDCVRLTFRRITLNV